MSANLSIWLADERNVENTSNNLTPTLSPWLADSNYNNNASQNLQITPSSTYSLASSGARAYGQYFESSYDAHGDDGSGYNNYQYSVTSYSDDGYAIYIESGGHDAYGNAPYSNYSNYSVYYNYGDYSNYYNYSRVLATFYWTKNNDGSTRMTGTETGLISTWAMAVQVNTLINLVNKVRGTSIATVTTGTLLTANLYNQIANAISATTITQGTKITVSHFYNLQQVFNSRNYYYTP